MRWGTSNRRWTLPLKRENIAVYDKADTTSKINGHTPTGVVEVSALFRTPGLKGDGEYFQVVYIAKGSPFLHGFIYESDVDLE
jgi:hypothetical protein